MKFGILLMILMFGILSCSSKDASQKKEELSSSNSEIEKAAVSVANQWLEVLAENKLEQSWNETADIFKRAIPKDQWVSIISNIDSNFGKIISRKLLSSKYYTSLPGAPDGEYVVIQFNTKFQKKENAIETITPMKDLSGQWKVSGYYIK